jgi:hypothetical protein
MIKKVVIILFLLFPQLYGAQSRSATSKELQEMAAENPGRFILPTLSPDLLPVSSDDFKEELLYRRLHAVASNVAVDFMDQGNPLAAFSAFEEAITLDLENKDAYARVQVAENLIYGISGALVPNEETKSKAARYLIEAVQIEFTRPDEPDHGGRMMRGFSEVSYQILAEGGDYAKALGLLKGALMDISPDPS